MSKTERHFRRFPDPEQLSKIVFDVDSGFSLLADNSGAFADALIAAAKDLQSLEKKRPTRVDLRYLGFRGNCWPRDGASGLLVP